jgi:hypothetical protein
VAPTLPPASQTTADGSTQLHPAAHSCADRLAASPPPLLPACVSRRTTLPLKKGLSSSAALCVLVARAFSRAYALRLTTRGEMQYAFEGERLTPSQVWRGAQGGNVRGTPPLWRLGKAVGGRGRGVRRVGCWAPGPPRDSF